MATTVENLFDTQQASPTSQGIIGGTISSSPAAAPASDSSASSANPLSGLQVQSYNTQTRDVNPATDTVQGQLNSILLTDSPLMQRARTIAAQQAAQRGLVNSSMAAGAGTAAMIDRATPIASQDAATYDARAKANMDATNTAGMFNVNQNNTLLGQGATITAQTNAQKSAQDFQAGQSSLDRTQQTNLQTGQQTFQAGQSALDRAQQTSLQAGQQTFQAGQSALDRSQQASLQQLQNDFVSAQSALQRAQEVALADKSQGAQLALQKAQQDFTAVQTALDRQQATQQQQAQIAAAQNLQDTAQQFQAVQQKLSYDQQTALTKLQASLNDASVSKQFASQTAQNTIAQINGILSNENFSPEAKQNDIANVIAMANSSLQWGSTFYNTPLPSIASPGGSATTLTPGGNS